MSVRLLVSWMLKLNSSWLHWISWNFPFAGISLALNVSDTPCSCSLDTISQWDNPVLPDQGYIQHPFVHSVSVVFQFWRQNTPLGKKLILVLSFSFWKGKGKVEIVFSACHVWTFLCFWSTAGYVGFNNTMQHACTWMCFWELFFQEEMLNENTLEWKCDISIFCSMQRNLRMLHRNTLTISILVCKWCERLTNTCCTKLSWHVTK